MSGVEKKEEGNAGSTKTREDEQKTIGKLLGDNDNSTDAIAGAASASIGGSKRSRYIEGDSRFRRSWYWQD